MKKIQLKREWSTHKAGSKLDVLQPGEQVRPGSVDAARAQALVDQKLAVEITDTPPADEEVAPAAKGAKVTPPARKG